MTDPAKRIIGHMNKDHQLALVDYVVVYGNQNLNNIRAKSVHITEVTDYHIILEYEAKNGTEKSLALEWNMVEDGEGLYVKSMLDIKAKLIAMAKYSAEKQGFSHKQVTKILPPASAGSIATYVFAALTVATLVKKDFLRVAIGFFWTLKSPGLESFLAFFEKRIFAIAVATYVAHILEMILITWPKTIKYRMPLATQLAWLGFTFMEGYFHMARLRTLTD